MPILYILIIIAFVMYIFYRIKAWRTSKPMLKQWITAKAQLALGSLLLLFGLNRLFLPLSTLIVIVCVTFIIVGTIYIIYAVKSYRFYLIKMIEESKSSTT